MDMNISSVNAMIIWRQRGARVLPAILDTVEGCADLQVPEFEAERSDSSLVPLACLEIGLPNSVYSPMASVGTGKGGNTSAKPVLCLELEYSTQLYCTADDCMPSRLLDPQCRARVELWVCKWAAGALGVRLHPRSDGYSSSADNALGRWPLATLPRDHYVSLLRRKSGGYHTR